MHSLVITIGRQYGSGGRLIGEAVANKLGIPFYNRNMIDMIAEKSGLAREYISRREDKVSSRMIWAPLVGDTGMSMLYSLSYYTNSDKMFFAQSEIIKDIAKKGSCVIVGRCADYILRERKNCLKVFVYGDKKDRMERIVQQYGVEQAKAAKTLDNTDNGRAKYYNHYTEMTWGDCRHYHLCIDSSRFGIEGAADVIVQAAKELME